MSLLISLFNNKKRHIISLSLKIYLSLKKWQKFLKKVTNNKKKGDEKKWQTLKKVTWIQKKKVTNVQKSDKKLKTANIRKSDKTPIENIQFILSKHEHPKHENKGLY